MAGPGRQPIKVVKAIRGDPALTPIDDEVMKAHPEWYSFFGLVYVNDICYHMYDLITDE